MTLPALALLRQRLGDAAGEVSLSRGVFVLTPDPAALVAVVRELKTEFGFDLFLDVTAVDWPERDLRFDGVYPFYATKHFVRVRVKTRVSEANPTVDSLVSLYGSAHFMDRECHEMYGIAFRGNRDLRPILLYEGFVGHPLRKDYPKEREQPLVPFRA